MKVLWTRRARRRLAEIGSYLARDSRERALGLIERLIAVEGQLGAYPYSGALAPEDGAYRQIAVEDYRIVYVIAEKEVRVMTIVAPRRSYGI